MKGLTHFLSGVALASFFSPAVGMASNPNVGTDLASSSFILVLGGLYGILPDTMDFKLGQFFSKAEYEVDCNPNDPDPKKMAETIGKAMEEAWTTGKYIKCQLFPMKLASNLWRQYMIKFDAEHKEVVVVINNIVSTSQVPYVNTAPEDEEKRIGRYKLSCPLVDQHGRPNMVDIMSGPQYGFIKDEAGVKVEFLPWHRTWSHSYLLGLMLSLPIWIIAWIYKWQYWWIYGLVAFLGFAIHITEDLTGHMGGSLIWPVNKTRYDGYCWFRASDIRANFMVDYTAITLIIFNLDRFTAQGQHLIKMHFLSYFFFFMLIPLAIFWSIATYLKDPETKDDRTIATEDAKAYEENIRKKELEFEADDMSF
jgi:hypothetical protein